VYSRRRQCIHARRLPKQQCTLSSVLHVESSSLSRIYVSRAATAAAAAAAGRYGDGS